MILDWHRFDTLTAARRKFSGIPCVYVQTDSEAIPIRIGKASKGLDSRYRGGTGYALDAAMHGSKNLVYVAEIPGADSILNCEIIERQLIWENRKILTFNTFGKLNAPSNTVELIHTGDVPLFDISGNSSSDERSTNT